MPAREITDIGDAARRQYIDAESTFLAFEEAVDRARETRGGMYWKQVANGRQYLIRTNPGNGQKSLGLRSLETEDTFTRFSARKVEIETRRKNLGQALVVQQRLNRALRVGRVPALVVVLLNAMDKASVSAHFTVVGTHALYAYEAAAGVRIEGAALATQDVDFLFDTQLPFAAACKALPAMSPPEAPCWAEAVPLSVGRLVRRRTVIGRGAVHACCPVHMHGRRETPCSASTNQ